MRKGAPPLTLPCFATLTALTWKHTGRLIHTKVTKVKWFEKYKVGDANRENG